jgi:hypothetical protein
MPPPESVGVRRPEAGAYHRIPAGYLVAACSFADNRRVAAPDSMLAWGTD